MSFADGTLSVLPLPRGLVFDPSPTYSVPLNLNAASFVPYTIPDSLLVNTMIPELKAQNQAYPPERELLGIEYANRIRQRLAGLQQAMQFKPRIDQRESLTGA